MITTANALLYFFCYLRQK